MQWTPRTVSCNIQMQPVRCCLSCGGSQKTPGWPHLLPAHTGSEIPKTTQPHHMEPLDLEHSALLLEATRATEASVLGGRAFPIDTWNSNPNKRPTSHVSLADANTERAVNDRMTVHCTSSWCLLTMLVTSLSVPPYVRRIFWTLASANSWKAMADPPVLPL